MSLDDSGAKQPSTAPSTKNEMAGLIASKDWSTTALGDTNNWSPSLKLIVGIMTASGFPMAVRWGPEFILIYNDGYRPFWRTSTRGHSGCRFALYGRRWFQN